MIASMILFKALLIDTPIQVGPTYGRKLIKGKPDEANIKVNEKRLSKSFQ